MTTRSKLVSFGSGCCVVTFIRLHIADACSRLVFDTAATFSRLDIFRPVPDGHQTTPRPMAPPRRRLVVPFHADFEILARSVSLQVVAEDRLERDHQNPPQHAIETCTRRFCVSVSQSPSTRRGPVRLEPAASRPACNERQPRRSPCRACRSKGDQRSPLRRYSPRLATNASILLSAGRSGRSWCQRCATARLRWKVALTSPCMFFEFSGNSRSSTTSMKEWPEPATRTRDSPTRASCTAPAPIRLPERSPALWRAMKD